MSYSYLFICFISVVCLLLQKIGRRSIPFQTKCCICPRKWLCITTTKDIQILYTFYVPTSIGSNYRCQLLYVYIKSFIYLFRCWNLFEIYFMILWTFLVCYYLFRSIPAGHSFFNNFLLWKIFQNNWAWSSNTVFFSFTA